MAKRLREAFFRTLTEALLNAFTLTQCPLAMPAADSTFFHSEVQTLSHVCDAF